MIASMLKRRYVRKCLQRETDMRRFVQWRMFRLAPAFLIVTFLDLRAEDAPHSDIQIHNNVADFRLGSDLVGNYRFKSADGTLAKPYLWPLFAPNGTAVTRAWPMQPAGPGGSTDHVHQKSLWFAHGEVMPEGQKAVDFWGEDKGHGVIVCTQERALQNRLVTKNEWRDASGRKLLDEERTIELFSLPDASLLVFEIDLCAGERSITFGDTKEGSFGVRVHDDIRQSKGGRIENADAQIGETNCWGRASAWCDYSGTVDGKTGGVAILDDPANRYPASWHVRGYGLMAANPFGRKASGFPAMRGRSDLAKLTQGEHLKLRYGVLVHLGNAQEGKVAEHFKRFVELRSK
jgi:hypothetical protein